MAATLVIKEITSPGRNTRLPEVSEVVAFCPGCKVVQTLWFTRSGLMQTRKYTQEGSCVFHDCNSKEPCRLYRL